MSGFFTFASLITLLITAPHIIFSGCNIRKPVSAIRTLQYLLSGCTKIAFLFRYSTIASLYESIIAQFRQPDTDNLHTFRALQFRSPRIVSHRLAVEKSAHCQSASHNPWHQQFTVAPNIASVVHCCSEHCISSSLLLKTMHRKLAFAFLSASKRLAKGVFSKTVHFFKIIAKNVQ